MSGIKLIRKVRIAPRELSVSVPVLGHDGVYAGHKDHDIVKVGRKSLREEWSVPAEDYEPAWSIDDRVVCSSFEGQVRAVSAESGERAWTARPRDCGVVLWREQVVIIKDSEFRLHRLDTGRLIEKTSMGVASMSNATLCGDDFVSCTSEQGDPVGAYSLASRRVLWTRNLFAEMKEQYGVTEKYAVLGIHPGGPGHFIATRGGSTFGCSLADGRILWHKAVTAPYGRLTVHEGMVILWMFGRMLALDERTGRVRYDVSYPGDFKLDAPSGAGPISGDHIVYGTNAGLLAVCNWRNGRLVSFYRHKEGLSRAVIADGRIFVTSYDGNLLIFEGLPT